MVLVRRRGGKKPLGRNMYKFENDIKMDRQEVGWGHALDWPGCGQGHCKCADECQGSITRGGYLYWLF